MGATINIDTGGTFTDGYFTHGDDAVRVKVETTPHDFTECLSSCVKVGADRLGYPSVQALLLDTDVFRFSSTIGTNSIIQGTGPRIGLFVSSGAADDLYGDAAGTLYGAFLRRDLVMEIADPSDSDDVRHKIRDLLVGGARIIVVSLRDSEVDPSGERAVKAVVQREYPRHYLGAVPCLLASDVTPRPGADRRTATAVINAYLHPDMVRTLYKADEDQRGDGFAHPLLIVHASGGVARVAKTRAIETYSSGPVGGVYGSARMAAHYSLGHVVTMDIGGTSTDVAVVSGGVVPFDSDPRVAGIAVHTPMVHVSAVGGGGGSIARRGEKGYTVGPDSVGASPGPACYGLGGTQPTATDAEVVIGHIDPAWFLGGQRRLDVDRARRALQRIAGDDTVEAAAWGIHRALVDVATREVERMLGEAGVAPGEATLFAFGGGGGVYGAEVARSAGIPRVFSFAQSSVFSAFGISGMDVSHVYEVPADGDRGAALQQLRERAVLDSAGEGFDPARLRFRLEVETDTGPQQVELNGDWEGAGGGQGTARLRATVAIAHSPMVRTDGSGTAAAASKGTRTVHTPEGAHDAQVYDRDRLSAGARVEGPALVEASDTTIVVPAGTRMLIDEFGTAIIEVDQQ